MPRSSNKKPPRSSAPSKDALRKPKKKAPGLPKDMSWVDYKDINLLRKFMSERGKIRARRVTGLTAQEQREVAGAIKVARELALLPYATRVMSEGKRRSRRNDEDRYEGAAEAADAANADVAADEIVVDADVVVVEEGE